MKIEFTCVSSRNLSTSMFSWHCGSGEINVKFEFPVNNSVDFLNFIDADSHNADYVYMKLKLYNDRVCFHETRKKEEN